MIPLFPLNVQFSNLALRMVSSDGQPSLTPWHALDRRQLRTVRSSHTMGRPPLRIARMTRQSSPVVMSQSTTLMRRQPSKSMPSLFIMRWSPTIFTRSKAMSSHSRSHTVHPGESLRVTPSKRTFDTLKNCTMRGRGIGGFLKNRAGGFITGS